VTLPEFDKLIEKDVKGLPAAGSERPLSSVVKTIDDRSGAPATTGSAGTGILPAKPAAQK
jgi:hypothetical protein